jgi:uncharacterized membrane protein YgcG
MSTLTKTLLAVLATMLVGGAAYVAAAPTHTAPKHVQAAADVKGPCDEAEHAADPRCASPQVPEDNPNHVEHRDRNKVEDNHSAGDDNQAEDVGDDNPGDDNPGEVADHANRGPGSPNSGPGNAEDRGDDVAMEDNSGPSGDDSSHSGSGHSGSDDSGSDDSGSGGSGRN